MNRAEWEEKNNYRKSKCCKTCRHFTFRLGNLTWADLSKCALIENEVNEKDNYRKPLNHVDKEFCL